MLGLKRLLLGLKIGRRGSKTNDLELIKNTVIKCRLKYFIDLKYSNLHTLRNFWISYKEAQFK